MAITSSDVKYYHPETVNTSDTNGGKRSETEVVFSEAGNAIAPVTLAEATTGVTKYHKLFVKLNNVDNEALYYSKFCLKGTDPADDSYLITLGSSTDTQADISSLTDDNWLGGCVLNTDVLAGSTTLLMDFEVDGVGINSDNELLITDGVNSEIFTVSAVSWSGKTATITIDSAYNSGNGLVNAYVAGTAIGGGLLDLGTITTSWTEISNPNSLTITGDITTYNYGTLTEDYLVDFLSSTTYRVAKKSAPTLFFDSTTGNTDATSYTTFDITADAYVANSNDNTSKLFTIPADFFGGTIDTGYIYEFSTQAAEKGIWFKRIVPALANGAIISLNISLRGEGV